MFNISLSNSIFSLITFSKQSQKDHTSKVWSHFSTIFVNNLKQDYVLCELCMLLIAYKHATDTGGMQKHVAFCSQKSSSIDELNEKKLLHVSIQQKIIKTI